MHFRFNNCTLWQSFTKSSFLKNKNQSKCGHKMLKFLVKAFFTHLLKKTLSTLNYQHSRFLNWNIDFACCWDINKEIAIAEQKLSYDPRPCVPKKFKCSSHRRYKYGKANGACWYRPPLLHINRDNDKRCQSTQRKLHTFHVFIKATYYMIFNLKECGKDLISSIQNITLFLVSMALVN